MQKKHLFVYTSGRRKRIEQRDDGTVASDFLYGYSSWKSHGVDAEYIESNDISHNYLSFRYWKLRKNNNSFARNLGIGNRSHFFVGCLGYLNQFDNIIATTDSIALGLLKFKESGELRASVCFLNMGLGGVLDRLSRQNHSKYTYYKSRLSVLLPHCENIISVGKGESVYLRREFEEISNKLIFLPFGIDAEFWRPPEGVTQCFESPQILFAGNDLNRDYKLILEIARRRQDLNFVFATSRLQSIDCPPNVKLLRGHLSTDVVTDLDMRKLYWESSMVLVLLNETLQPSGQTVSLQAMASGCPVVITETSGLWDPEVIVDDECCVYVEQGNIESVMNRMDQLLTDNFYRSSIVSKARETVLKHYQAIQFSDQLLRIVNNS